MEGGRSSFYALTIRADVVVTPQKRLSDPTGKEDFELFEMMKQLSLLSQNDLSASGSVLNSAARVAHIPVGTKFHPVLRAHEQAGRVRSMELEIRLASTQGWSILCTPLETCQSI